MEAGTLVLEGNNSREKEHWNTQQDNDQSIELEFICMTVLAPKRWGEDKCCLLAYTLFARKPGSKRMQKEEWSDEVWEKLWKLSALANSSPVSPIAEGRANHSKNVKPDSYLQTSTHTRQTWAKDGLLVQGNTSIFSKTHRFGEKMQLKNKLLSNEDSNCWQGTAPGGLLGGWAMATRTARAGPGHKDYSERSWKVPGPVLRKKNKIQEITEKEKKKKRSASPHHHHRAPRQTYRPDTHTHTDTPFPRDSFPWTKPQVY